MTCLHAVSVPVYMQFTGATLMVRVRLWVKKLEMNEYSWNHTEKKSAEKNRKKICVVVKALLYGASSRATCLAIPLQDKLHKPLHRVRCRATVRIIATQVA